MADERHAVLVSDAGRQERERVLALIRRYGLRPTCFQVLGPAFRYWFADDDAGIAYTDTGDAWVVAGMPLAPRERWAEVARAFAREARAHGRRVRYFGVDDQFARDAGLSALYIGELPVWDPRHWPSIVRTSRSLREQLRRARAKGVTVRRVPAAEVEAEGDTRAAMATLVRHWLSSRRAAALGFVVDVQPFQFARERRYFAAESDGQLLAFLVAVPVFARNGWLIETIFRDRRTPNGVSELLIDDAMRAFAEAGATFATLGLVPLTGDINRWLRLARKLTVPLYNFAGLRSFKAKLRPEAWEPVYIAYAHREQALFALGDIIAAFTPRGRLRFALASLVKLRREVVLALALLLVPWILVLLAADTERWFPSRGVQIAWVAFDVFLVAALLSLARRWRVGLATWLAGLTAADAGLTLVQALTYNAARSPSPFEWLVIAVAVSAPALASLFLWRARH